MIAVTLLLMLIPIIAALFLFVIFRGRGRIEALEARVAMLENALDREARLNVLEGRINDPKR